MQIKTLTANGFEFRCRMRGNRKHEPVVFLHGFPDTSCMWEGLMEACVGKGYFCLAPDLRGYSSGARPKDKKAYDLREVIEDIVSIADAAGIGRFHLVGHDWGAALGWKLVEQFPERILTWTAMAVPHLQAFGESLRSDPGQRKKSRYMALIQVPKLPEWLLSRKDYALLRKRWEFCTPSQLTEYEQVFRDPGVLKACLSYYRVNYPLLARAYMEPILGSIQVPTLTLLGKQDPTIGTSVVEMQEKWIEAPHQHLDLEAGHWMVQEAPLEVEEAVSAHLSRFA